MLTSLLLLSYISLDYFVLIYTSDFKRQTPTVCLLPQFCQRESSYQYSTQSAIIIQMH